MLYILLKCLLSISVSNLKTSVNIQPNSVTETLISNLNLLHLLFSLFQLPGVFILEMRIPLWIKWHLVKIS